MPALASPTTWRLKPYAADFYVWLYKPVVIFRAQVGGGGIQYPGQRITYQSVTVGAYTDIKPGMLIRLGSTAGLDDYGRTTIRKAADATYIYVNWFSQGNRDGELDIHASSYIEVLDFYPVAAKTPRFSEDGTSYKSYDLDFATYGIEPPPKANGGPGCATFENDDEEGTVYFADQGSFGVTDGATISSQSWDFVDGTPSSSSSATPGNVTFPTGFRNVSYTVTDSNGNTHTQRIPILVASKTTSPYRPIRCQITRHTRRNDGQEMEIRLLETLDEDDYPDGTLAMVWASETYKTTSGSLAGPTGREHMVFVGWLQSERHENRETREGGMRFNATLTLVDVAGRLKTLPGFPQEVRRKTTASNWAEMQIGSCSANIPRFVHYILHWHSTALELADFFWDGDEYTFSWLESDGQSLWEQADSRCEAIAYKLTCDRLGRIKMKADPQLLDSTDRAATATILSLLESDWTTVSYAYTRPPRSHWQRSAALLITTGDADSETPTPVQALAPGDAPGQGLSAPQINYQLVQDSAEFLVREGRRYVARQNARYGFYKINLAHGGEAGIEPADMEWIALTVGSANADRRGRSISAGKFLPVEVSFEYDHANAIRRADVTAEREATDDFNAIEKPVATKQSNLFGEYSGGEWALDQIDGLLDLNLIPSVIDYGPTLTYDPDSLMQLDQTPGAATEYGKAWLVTSDCRAVRLGWPSGTLAFTNISPGTAVQTAVGTVVGAAVDPFNMKALYILGETGVGATSDYLAATPSWRVVGRNTTMVTFDASGIAYSILNSNGSVATAGSYITAVDGPFLKGTAGSPTYAEFRITLSSSVNITGFSASIGRWKTYVGGGVNNSNFVVKYYNAAGTLLSTVTKLVNYGNDYWYTLTDSTAVSGVTRIDVYWEQNGWFGNPMEIGIDNFKFTTSTTATDTGTPFGGFQGVQNYKGMFVWLSKKTVSSVDYVYFNKTTDYFRTIQAVRIAKWISGMTYGVTVRANNWRYIYVTAGDTADSTAAVYASYDGGSTFAMTSRLLTTHGGAIWYNRSTETPNVQNKLEANLLTYYGMDGSNNQQVAKGVSASPVTVVTDAARYLETERAIYALPSDLSFVRLVSRNGYFYKSSDAGATWSAATSTVTGGASFVVRGLSGWPTDSNFAFVFGYRVLSFTTDVNNFTNLWTDYDTWRSANLGSGIGERIIALAADLSVRYKETVNT